MVYFNEYGTHLLNTPGKTKYDYIKQKRKQKHRREEKKWQMEHKF